MEVIVFVGLALLIFGMVQAVMLLRQTRIINSMTLKVLLRICEDNNIKIDIEKIQDEVEKNM